MRWPWQQAKKIPPAPTPGECGQRGGRWHVHWSWPAKEANREDAFLPLAMHPDSPTLSLKADYDGPLCPCELHYLAGADPTYVVSTQWQFAVKPA